MSPRRFHKIASLTSILSMARRLLTLTQRRASLLAAPWLVLVGSGACSPAHAQVHAPLQVGGALDAPPVGDVGSADLNGDGHADLLIATRGVEVALDPDDNSSPATWARRSFPSTVVFDDLATADLDGDGRLDIVASSYTSNVIQWWLTGSDLTPQASSYIALGAINPTNATKCAATPTANSHIVVSSVSLVDVEGDGQVELGVSTFSNGVTSPTEVAVYTYSRESGCFHKVRSRSGPATMATQFADVNADGRQDLVVSFKALQPVSESTAQWGEWFDLALGEHQLVGQPLVVPFAKANAKDNIGVVDIDVLPAGAGGAGRPAWFALAITTHRSLSDEQHQARRGGHVEVVDIAGTRLWSSEDWEKSVEDESADLFTMPTSSRFTAGGGLLASFMRGAPSTASRCPYYGGPCAGPVLHVPSLQAPSPERLPGEHRGLGLVELPAPSQPGRARFIMLADFERGLGVVER
jgi:hypothetical protein